MAVNSVSKGFVYTLESILAAALFLSMVIVVIPEVDRTGQTQTNVQQTVHSSLLTLDRTGRLRDNLTPKAIEKDLNNSIPDAFNFQVIVRTVNTDERYIETADGDLIESIANSIIDQADWDKGNYNLTTVETESNPGNLGIGYQDGPYDGLRAFWRLDEQSSTVTDYSGNNNDGSNSGGTSAPGVFSTDGYHFDDNGESVDISGFGWSDSDFTIAAWVKPDGWENPGHDQIVFLGDDSTDQEINFGNRDGQFRFDYYNGSDHGITAGKLPPEDEWSFVTGTFDASTGNWSYYINSSLDTTVIDDVDSDIGSGPDSLISGDPAANSRSFNGTIDEVRIYDRKLSQKEIEELYFNGQDGTFYGNYNQTGIDIPTFEKVTKLTVNSTNVSGPANTSWIRVEHSSGEKDTVKLNDGDNIVDNYSISIPSEGGSVDIYINITSGSPSISPIIKELKIWSEERENEKNISFNKTGEDFEAQFWIKSSDSLNITFNNSETVNNHDGEEYLLRTLETGEGFMNFTGDSSLHLSFRNYSTRGKIPNASEIKNVNYILKENMSKEVKVSLWEKE